MKVGIAVLNEGQKNEILTKHISASITVIWANTTDELLQLTDADFWIDCTFSGNEAPLTEKPLLIHAPALTLTALNSKNKVGRFCAWNTFLKREIWEVAVAAGTDSTWVSELMSRIGWKIVLVKDTPGLITPRIICNIINEAYRVLLSGISSEEEINIAMQLGTNYPLGPLEWAKKIGLQQVDYLLRVLGKTNAMYQPVFSV